MDFQNKAELLGLTPESKEKIYMLSAYAEGPWQYREIPDPYLGDLEATRYRRATANLRSESASVNHSVGRCGQFNGATCRRPGLRARQLLFGFQARLEPVANSGNSWAQVESQMSS